MSDLFPDDPVAVQSRREAVVRGLSVRADDPSLFDLGESFNAVRRGVYLADEGLSALGSRLANIPNTALETPSYFHQSEAQHRLTDPTSYQRTDLAAWLDEQVAVNRREIRRITPDPTTLSQTQQILSGVIQPLTAGLVGAPLGPAGPALTLGASFGAQSYDEQVESGVDPETAERVAIGQAGIGAVMGVLPASIPIKGARFALWPALGRAASGAAINVGVGSWMRQSTHDTLMASEYGDYSENAERYQALDGQAMMVDAVLGAVFGTIFAHVDSGGTAPRAGEDGGPLLDAVDGEPIAPILSGGAHLDAAIEAYNDGDLVLARAHALMADRLGEQEGAFLAEQWAREGGEEVAVEGDALGFMMAAERGLIKPTSEQVQAAMVMGDDLHARVTTAPGIPLNVHADVVHTENLRAYDEAASNGEEFPQARWSEEDAANFAPRPDDVEAMARDIEFAVSSIEDAPTSLVDWVRRQGEVRDDRGRVVQRGGIRDDRGDIGGSASDGKRGFASLLSPTGRTIDDLIVNAWEDGFFPDHADPSTITAREFIDAVNEEGSNPGSRTNDSNAAFNARSARDVIRHYEKNGIDVSLRGNELRRALSAITREADAEAAIARVLEQEGFSDLAREVESRRERIRQMGGEIPPDDAYFSRRLAESNSPSRRSESEQYGDAYRILADIESAIRKGEPVTVREAAQRLGIDPNSAHAQLSQIRNGKRRPDLAAHLARVEETLVAQAMAREAGRAEIADQVRAAADEGLSISQAAARLNLTKSQVAGIVQRNLGINFRGKSGPKPNDAARARDAQWLAENEAGDSFATIGARENVSRATIAGGVRRARIRRGQATDTAPDFAAMAERLGIPEERVRAIAARREDAQFSQRPIFESAVERTIAESTTARASGAQWWSTISRASGVKREELQWIGLEDYLKAQEGSITREEVLAFVRENGITVEETVLGEGESPQAELQRQLLPLVEEQDRLFQELSDLSNQIVEGGEGYQAALERRRVVDDRAREIGPTIIDLRRRISDMAGESETKWSSYTLPGGENYRELLLRLPEFANEPTPVAWKVRASGGRFEVYDANNPGTEGIHYAEDRAKAEVLRGRFQRAERETTGGVRQKDTNFHSSHFDQPNILAHVRFNERTDAQGKRTLFIEEVQSDWHQKGREQGYALTDAEINAALAEAGMKARHNGTNWIIETVDGQAVPNRLIGQTVAPEYNGKPSTVFAGDLGQAAGMALGRRGMSGALGGVPDAPFKNNAWASLSMKRMIRWGAENGFDQIAWTRGQHQVERFSLAREMSRLYYNPTTKEFIGQARGGGQHREQNVSASRLAELLGTEASKQLLDAPINRDGEHEIAAGDIKVGGEGMRAFYDRILPNIANDLGKKFGARVGETEIDTALPVDRVRSPLPGQVKPTTVHSLPITPDMRDSAMDSQALFSREQNGEPRPASPADLIAAAEREFGADWQSLTRAGNVEVVQSSAEVPTGLLGLPRGVQAVHLRDSRTTYFIANNVRPEDMKGLILHEVGVHHGMEAMVGKRGFREIMRQIDRMVDADHPALVEARALAERYSARDEHIPEETLAYLIETHADLPLVTSIMSQLRQWMVKTFGTTFGMQLTVDDLRSLAITSLRRVAEQARREAGPVTEVLPIQEAVLASIGPDAGPPQIENLRSQGFDVDTPLFHGTTREFTTFERGSTPNRPGEVDEGIWLAKKPEMARGYGEGAGGRTLTVYTRGRYFRPEDNPALQAQLNAVMDSYPAGPERLLRENGYAGYDLEGSRVVFDPADITIVPARTAPDGGRLEAGNAGEGFRSTQHPGGWTHYEVAAGQGGRGRGTIRISESGSVDIAPYDGQGGGFADGVRLFRNAIRAMEQDAAATGRTEYRFRAMTPRLRELYTNLTRNHLPEGWRLVSDTYGLYKLERVPGSALPNAGDFPQFSFGGRKARTAENYQRIRAEEMESAGADRDAIWRETGWARGDDGFWRFEIDTGEAALKFGELKPVEFSETQRLSEVLEFPSLFEAYPQLRNLRVDIAKGKMRGMWTNADFDPIPGVMDNRVRLRMIVVRAESNGTALSVLLHEVQHAIQDIEGFAQGTSADVVGWDAYARSAGEIEANDVQARLGMSNVERASTPPGSSAPVAKPERIVSLAAPGDAFSQQRPQPGQNGDNLVGRRNARRDPIEAPEYQERVGRLQEALSRDDASGESGASRGQRSDAPVKDGDAPDKGLARQARDVLALSGVHIARIPNPLLGSLRATIDSPVDLPARLRDALQEYPDARDYNAGIDFDVVEGGKSAADPSAPEGRRDVLYIRWTSVPDALQGAGIGSWLYRQVIDWAHRRGLNVYSDTSLTEKSWPMYDRLKEYGYEVEQISATTRDPLTKTRESINDEPIFEIRRSYEEKPYDAAEHPVEDYQIDGPTLRERQQRINDQRAREDEYQKKSPIEQALADEPEMKLSMGRGRSVKASEAIEMSVEAQREAVAKKKAFEAAVRCAVRHGGSMAARSFITMTGRGATQAASASQLLGQGLGLTLAGPAAYAASHLARQNADPRGYAADRARMQALNVQDAERKYERGAHEAALAAGLDAPSAYEEPLGGQSVSDLANAPGEDSGDVPQPLATQPSIDPETPPEQRRLQTDPLQTYPTPSVGETPGAIMRDGVQVARNDAGVAPVGPEANPETPSTEELLRVMGPIIRNGPRDDGKSTQPKSSGASKDLPRGMVEEGNIDLTTRPVVRNDDGSISTVRSMSFEDDDGREVLVPTVSDDGQILSDDDAIQQYYDTGKHLGIFSNARAANAYARQLHRDQERMYRDRQ